VLVSTGLSLDIFPNPARQTSTVAVSQREVGVLVVKVYDVLGREVATLHAGSLAAGRHAFEFDVTTLPGGVYVVRAVGRERAVTQRFTVAR
ncbi:MAG: T9SS type A sorting domain-containing protein, partial [Bacteroidota bacterium]